MPSLTEYSIVYLPSPNKFGFKVIYATCLDFAAIKALPVNTSSLEL